MKTYLITRRKWLMGLLCLSLACNWAVGEGKNTVVKEYEVKAAFLYNFTQFTDWPGRAFADTNSPIVIGIVGEDPFGKTLDDAVSDELVNGHPLVIKRLRASDDLAGCHVLFISRSEKSRLKPILATVRDLPILTVSEADGFGQLGGIFNFVTVDKTIRFEINAGAAQQAGVKISSKLLNLPKAIKVETRKE